MGQLMHSVASTTLTLHCPRCRADHPDHWECLDVNELGLMHCRQCRQQFAYYVKECFVCAAESVFIWQTLPSPHVIAALICQSCGDALHESIHDTSRASPAI